MRYNPSELYEKLVSLGAKIDSEPDHLMKMCSDMRAKRKIAPKPGTKENFLPEINYAKKGRPLQQIPEFFIKDVLNFIGYISDTGKRSFCIKMRNTLTGAFLTKFKPYIHRWTSVYRKGVLAKFYQLEAYTGNNISEVEFITLTTYQKGLSQEEALLNLKEGRKKLLDILRQRYGTQDYVWMLEPHHSGFFHLHLVYFMIISEHDQDTLKKVWHEKYEFGDYEHGLFFSAPRPSADGVCVGGSIKSIRNYLMKYVSKSLYSEGIHEYEFHGKIIPLDMSMGELLFNAILKKTKTRLWGCSRHLSQVMARPEKPESNEWECVEVDQYYGLSFEDQKLFSEKTEEIKDHLLSVLWTKEGRLHPYTKKTWELIKSLPRVSKSDENEAKLNGYKIESQPIPIINKHGVTISYMDNFNVYKPLWGPIEGS